MDSSPLDSFILSIAANLATDLLKAGARQLADLAYGDAEVHAMQRAYNHAFARMLAGITSPLDAEMLEHVSELFSRFVADPQVNRMLLDIALTGTDLPLEQLHGRFEALGYEPSTLPLDFDTAMSDFVIGLAAGLLSEAAQKNSPLFNRVSLGRMAVLENLLKQNKDDLAEGIRKDLKTILKEEMDNRFAAVQDNLILHVNGPEPMTQPTDSAGRPLKVFLCHSSNDKPTVRDLHRRLLQDGVQPWLDEIDLLPGQDWEHEIKKAVRDSDVVAACLSKGSVSKTGYVQKEIRIALDAADLRPEGQIYIIPARLEECTVPDRLSKWQWVDLFHPNGYDKLLKALRVMAKELGVLEPSCNSERPSTKAEPSSSGHRKTNPDNTSKQNDAPKGKYNIQIGEAKNVIIGDNARMTVNGDDDDD
jgi:hypothetical protein